MKEPCDCEYDLRVVLEAVLGNEAVKLCRSPLFTANEEPLRTCVSTLSIFSVIEARGNLMCPPEPSNGLRR